MLVPAFVSGIGDARAAQPKSLSVFGLSLGPGPEAGRAALEKRYPQCAVLPSVYHESEGYPDNVIAILDIARGTLEMCRDGPAGSEVEDEISTMYAHPSVDRNQPLYQIDFQRTYPDVVLGTNTHIRYPFDKLRAELVRTYGIPLEEHREKTSSSSADIAKSLAIDRGVKREDYLVRMLWAEKGRVVGNWEPMECDCGLRFVRADIEISKSTATIPKNQYYVLTLKVFVQDAEIAKRQDAWNAQWQKKKQ
jgi:hypothetical protein